MIDREKIEEIAGRYGAEVTYTEKDKGGIIPKTIISQINKWEDYKIDEYNNNFAVSSLNKKLPYNNINKFENFTDDELYILKRQAIESSWEICGCGSYLEFEVRLHEKLMNEIADEIKRREI